MKQGSIRMRPWIWLIMALGLMAFYFDARGQAPQLNTGIGLYDQGKYPQALEQFNLALGNPGRLAGEELPKAYFYRALTFLRLYNTFIVSDPENGPVDKDLYLVSAYNDLEKARSAGFPDYAARAGNQLEDMQFSMTQEGLKWLNMANDLKAAGERYDREADQALAYFVPARSIYDTYLVNDLLGQALVLKNKNAEALEAFKRSEDYYQRQLPDKPDFLIGYVFYREAVIDRGQGNVDQALIDIERGIKFLDQENQRLGRISNDLTSKQLETLFEDYEITRQNLTDLKLEILLNHPEKYYIALMTFKEEIEKNPGDVDLLIGYGSLLERSNTTEAISVYKSALAIDPDNLTANYNVGVLYYSMGKEYYDQARESINDDKYSFLLSESLDHFDEAKPYFEKALEIEPGLTDAIVALKTIAMVTDDQESYKKYEQMETGQK